MKVLFGKPKTCSLKRLSALSALSLLVLFINGCSPNPLDSLKDNQPSAKYTESFWNNEQKINSSLWQQAIKICSEQAYKSAPNCGSIHSIQMFANPLPYHKYGEGKGFSEMPTIK
jgi:hypothetical protein